MIPLLLIILEMVLLAYPLSLSQAKPLRIVALLSVAMFLSALWWGRSLFLFFLNGFLLTLMFAGTLPWWDRYAINLYGTAIYGLLCYLFWESSAFYVQYNGYHVHSRFVLGYILYLGGTGGGFLLVTICLGVLFVSGFRTIWGVFRPLLLAIGSALLLLGLLLWMILWRRHTLDDSSTDG